MPETILILHNTYQQAGGEDAVATREAALLREHGHDVHLHIVSNDVIQGWWRKAVTAWQTSHSRWGRRETLRIINETGPDIVHVHNFTLFMCTTSAMGYLRNPKEIILKPFHLTPSFWFQVNLATVF